MENILNSLQGNTTYLVLFAGLAIWLVFSIIKKVVKLILIAAILFLAYLAWLHWTGQETSTPDAVEPVVFQNAPSQSKLL